VEKVVEKQSSRPTSVPRPLIGVFEFVLGATALGAIFGGVIPMLSAIVVSNRVIDRGDPNATKIMSEWDSWAFTLSNFLTVFAGSLVFGYLLIRLYRKGQVNVDETT
jgi:hypothetical protein